MTRYVEAFSWPGSIGRFLAEVVRERPLLHVCSGRSPVGDVRTDRYELSDVRADWRALPFAADSFAAVFADPPWDGSYKRDSAFFICEALRIAPVVYCMSPWLYGSARAQLVRAWVRQMPGVNNAIVLACYHRREGAEAKRSAAGVELEARGTVLPLL